MGIKVKTRKSIEGTYSNGDILLVEEANGEYTLTVNEDELYELEFSNKKEFIDFVDTLVAMKEELNKNF